MSLCPEFEERAAMTDGAFWEHVLLRHGRPPSEDDVEYDLGEPLPPDPCPECGERGACGYDAEGRALIHVTAEDDR